MRSLENILFGFSRKRNLSILSFLISIVLFLIYDQISNLTFCILIILTNYITVLSIKDNKLGLIPSSRYLFIVAPGFLQLLVWTATSGNVTVAILGNDYINSSLVNFVAAISTLSAASSNLGFILPPFILKKFVINIKFNENYTKLFFLGFIIFAVLYGRSLGMSLGDSGSYSQEENTNGTTIGTLNVFFFFFFSLFFIYKYWLGYFTKIEFKIYLIITLITTAFIALRGVRQDSIGFLLAIFSIIYIKRNPKKNIYRSTIILFFLSWIGSVISGIIREEFATTTITSLLQNPILPFTIILPSGYIVFNMNTASMTVGTLNIIPYKIIERGYLFGKSYIEWIPRTFPDFIYPNRPLGPEFEMKYGNEWFGWGGIHETSEAYWNFGIIGIIIIPFIISYLINSLGKTFLRSKSLFSAIPIVWLIMMPRWIWYQSFAIYKSTLTMVVIIFIIYSFTSASKNKFN